MGRSRTLRVLVTTVSPADGAPRRHPDELIVEVSRDRQAWIQSFSRGKPTTKLKSAGPAPNRRGTTVTFHPDPQIFGKQAFVA